ARRSRPYTERSCAMRASVSRPNGALPSNACSTMPSSRSPRVMSWYSATPFSTLSRRFSSFTPVWTRSTSRGLAALAFTFAMALDYTGTYVHRQAAGEGRLARSRVAGSPVLGPGPPAARLLHRDRLREVPRLVDVGAAAKGGVVGEELERHRVHDRRDDRRMRRHLDHVQSLDRLDARVLVRHHVELAAAGAHLLQVRLELL